MKTPTKLSICGIDCEIIYRNDRMVKDGVGSGGSYHAWSSKIWVDTNQSEEMSNLSLVHEVIEAITYLNDLKLDHSQISTIATGVYGVIKQL